MIWRTENHENFKNDREIHNSDWMIGGPWYHTSICKKLHGKAFEAFIINSRTDWYNTLWSIDAYEKEHQSSSCNYGSSGRGYPLTKNSTTESL